MLKFSRNKFFGVSGKYFLLLIFILAVFSFGKGRFLFVKASPSQINLYPTTFTQDQQKSNDNWQGVNNSFTQELSANSIFEEFNAVNSMVFAWGEDRAGEENDTASSTESASGAIDSSQNASDSASSTETSESQPAASEAASSSEEKNPDAGAGAAPKQGDIMEFTPLAPDSSQYGGNAGGNGSANDAPAQTQTDNPAPSSEPQAAPETSAPQSNAGDILHRKAFRNTIGNVYKLWQSYDLLKTQDVYAQEGEASNPFTIQKSIIFDNFSVPLDFEETEKAQAVVHLSMAGYRENSSDKLEISYAFHGGETEDWKLLDVRELKDRFSNQDNGGYFDLYIPDELTWEEIKNLEIKLKYSSQSELKEGEGSPVFIDAVWLEAKYDDKKEEKKPEEDGDRLLSRQSAEDAKNLERGFSLSLLGGKRSFKTTEMPDFDFRFEKKKGLVKKIVDGVFYAFRDEYKNIAISAKVQGLRVDGKEDDAIQPKVRYSENGEFEIYFPDNSRSFKPGNYVMEVTIADGNDTYTSKQFFAWGVLAMNFDKSVYKPNEKAYIQMAVLDENGDTICDADSMLLEIRRPDGSMDYISSDNGELIYNKACGLNNIIDDPDYYGHFAFGEAGYYDFKLTANTKNGQYTIGETVEVKSDEASFVVERIGPTRINPKALYKMNFKVTAKEDYAGELVEEVPASFGLQYNSGIDIRQASNTQELHFKINLRKGETQQLYYVFDAPDISPEFYLLGPATIGDFKEERQWQIASDMVRGEVAHSFVSYDPLITNNMRYTTDGWWEVPQYLVASSTFQAGKKYLIAVNFSISNDDATMNSNPMARVRHGNTQFDDSLFAWESRRAATNQVGHGYNYFTVWTAVAGEDIHVDVSIVGNTRRNVQVMGYQAFAINLSDKLTENADWYYATNAQSGNLTTSWSTNGASINIAGQGHDWLIAGQGNFNSLSTTADFLMRLNNTTDAVTRSDCRYEGEDTADYRPVVIITGETVSGTKTWRLDAEADTVTSHSWTQSKIFALDLSNFRDHLSGTSTASVAVAPQSTWVNTYGTANYYVPAAVDTIVWSNEMYYVNTEDTKVGYSRVDVDGVTTPAGFNNFARELPNGTTDRLSNNNFFITNLSKATHTINVYMDETVDATPNPAANGHNLIAFSAELAPVTILSVLSDAQYRGDATTTIPLGGYSDGGAVLSAIASDVAASTSTADFYFQVIASSSSFTTATTAPGSYCSASADYQGCASKIWKVSSSSSSQIAKASLSLSNFIDNQAYKWQTLVCDKPGHCSDWNRFSSTTPTHFIVDATAPVAPGDLTLGARTSRSITLNFGYQAVEANFDKYRIFYKQGTSGVTTGDTELADANLGYQNYNGATQTTVSGLLPGTSYVFNIWVYDKAGHVATATEVMLTTLTSGRAKTVQFSGGSYVANGTTGQLTDTQNSFGSFNFSLAESGVSIEDAYVVFESAFESYNTTNGAYNGYSLSFDSCQSPCTVNAWSGNGNVVDSDSSVLANDEGGGNMARLVFDVTKEAQLAAYGGGSDMTMQIGYRLNANGRNASSISAAKAVLYVTYTYDKDSTSLTNTVVYPLESTSASDSGTRRQVQADDCALDSSCPLFAYKMDIPEYGSSPSAARLSQWYRTYDHNNGNAANDISIDVNIQGSDANSGAFIHEAANGSDVSNMLEETFSNVAGYSENASQQLEIHATTPTANPGHYMLGGEVVETYSASSSASIKTRTVSFPMGVLTNGLSNASSTGSVKVFFPENGRGKGKVEIKKAWFRVKTTRTTNSASTINLSTQVGGGATSTALTYNFFPGTNVINPSFNIIHVLPASDYDALAAANGQTGVNVSLTYQSPIANPMGVSAELIITYAYSSEESGYLASLDLFAGQPKANSQSATSVTAAVIMPEGQNKTLLGAMVLMSSLTTDTDGAMGGNANSAIYDVNISTGTPVCTNAYEARADGYNSFTDFYKNVAGAMDTTHNQAYQICFSNNGATDTSGEAKMNGQLVYTYQYFDPPSVIVDADSQHRSDNFTNIGNGGWTNEDNVYLSAYSEDTATTTSRMDFFFQAVPNGTAFATSTAAPGSSCPSGTAFGSCSSKIWKDSYDTSASAPWYNSSWNYRKKMTISASRVVANQSGFVVLATTTDANLAYMGSGGHMASSTGGDMVVTDSDGQTPLKFEREKYDNATGELILWIKTDISSTTNKNIYLYYGNAAATGDASDAKNVWDDNYGGVWHLKESGSGAANEYQDSTKNGNNGQGGSGTAGRIPAQADGWIGKAQSFDGSGATGDYIDCGNKASVNAAKSQLTVEAWIKHTIGGGDGHIAANGGGWGQNGFSTFWYGNRIRVEYNGDTGTDDSLIADDGKWHHLVQTWDANTDMRYLFVDGRKESLANYLGSQINAGAYNFNIGRMANQPNGYLFSGLIDEVRVSSSSRSDAWVLTEYNNEKDVANFIAFSPEESYTSLVYPGNVHVTAVPDDAVGYKWQVLACNDNSVCSSWNAFDVAPNFKVDNTPPTAPGNLTLATSTPTSVTLKFGSQTTEANFLYYKLFYKEGLSGVTTGNTEHVDSNLNFKNYNNVSTTVINNLQPDTDYVFNIWAYDAAGNIVSATEFKYKTSQAAHYRGSTVKFIAGTYSADGTTGQNTNTYQTFGAFNYKLAEKNVSIKNAYVVFEAQYMAYAAAAAATGYELGFDTCAEPCTANAWSGSGAVNQTDNTILSYSENESDQVRLLFDVTNEVQLAAYAGDKGLMKAQVGYNIKSAATANSIATAKAWLVLTYVYDGDNSKTYTNTVSYPLKSSLASDLGSRQTRQADDCSLNTNCPLFNYNVAVPEISEKLDNWFQTYSGVNGNGGVDVLANVNIQGVDVNSNTIVHEAANGATQAQMPTYVFKGVYGFAENTAQQLEYHSICAGTAAYDAIGGEVFETYIASTTAPVKTRTVTFPIGIVDNGQNTNISSSSANVYFPENGDGSGIVNVKAAYFRVNSNYHLNANSGINLAYKVGASSTSPYYNYFVNPGSQIPNPNIRIIQAIGDNDLAVLGQADINSPVKVYLYAQAQTANWGGISGELVVTYTYSDESSGYLSTMDIYGGQSTTNANSTLISKTTAKAVFPELRGTKTLRGADMYNTYLLSASDGTMPGNIFLMDSNVSTGSVTCTDSHAAIDDSTNAFVSYFKNVTGAFSTADNQAYGLCLSASAAADATAGAKMNSIISYTYQWEAPLTAFTQSDWRWYENNDAVQPANALANEKARIDNVNIGDSLRLRMNVGITLADLLANTQTLKLQYGRGSDCTMIGSWTDVGPIGGTADWLGKNNPTPADADPITAVLLDSSTVKETYEESNPSATNPNAISVGNFGEWDWALYNNKASSSDYCFRMIKTNGARFEDYLLDSYPKLGTAPSNTKPNAATNLGQYKSDGTTAITNSGWINSDNVLLTAAATDPNINEMVTLYFELKPSAGSFTTATSQPSGACVYGTPYDSCASKIWFAAPSVPGDFRTSPFIGTTSIAMISTSTSDYKWQVLSCDDDAYCSNWVNPGMSPNFRIDTDAPSKPGNLTLATSTPTSLTLNFGASSTDANFATYKIFYRLGTKNLSELDNQLADANLGFINYNGAATTSIPNLSAGSPYVINIWAYDQAGNKASATAELIATTTSSYTPPTGAIVNASQRTDGSGGIDVVFLVDDNDNDNTLRAKLEYVQGLACDFSSPLDPTIDETDENVTATYGDPKVDNNSVYQVGTSSGWIETSPGSNYVFVDWLSKSNVGNVNDSYCLRLTVNDGIFDQNLPLSTRTVLVDNQAPSTPGPLTLVSKDYTSVRLAFGTPSADPVFDRYHIFYKKATSGVSILDTEWNDTNLLASDYKRATSTNITGLEPNTQYVFNIWAYDHFGNKASSTEINVKTNARPTNSSADQQYAYPALSVVQNGNWSAYNDMVFRASTHDQDSGDLVTFYYQIIDNSSSFATAVAAPANACTSTVAYASCASKIWKVSTTTSSLPTDWYDGNWLYRKTITVNASNTPVSYANYPLLATTTGADFASKARPDGHDIIFTDSDGKTLLPFEREYFNSTTGALAAWVSVNISSTTNKTIYMYYGNNSYAADLSTSTAIWDSSYRGVWHLGDFVVDESSQSNAHLDSTKFYNYGSQFGNNEILSAIGYGQEFDGNDYISVGSNSSLNIADQISMEAWVKSQVSGANVWNYARTVTMSTSTKQANFQVNLQFSSANFTYANAKSDGSDLRFYDTAGNALSYWTEYWNVGGNSSVWIKIPNIGTTQFIMRYGNASAATTSDIAAVMDAGNLRYFYYSGMAFNTLQGNDLDNALNIPNTTGVVQIKGNSWENLADNMSIRWQGFVKRANTGVHTFYIGGDDGDRLYVNNALIANDWSDHGYRETNGTRTFASDWEAIRFEYYENGGTAQALLQWDPGTGRASIPAGNLMSRKYDANEPVLSLGTERSIGINKNGAYGISFADSQVIAYINATKATTSLNGNWNHIAMTYDRTAGSNQLKLYVNGSQAKTAAYSSAINANAEDFLIGDSFTGNIDELKLLGTARDSNRILTDYRNESGSLSKMGNESLVQSYYETSLVMDLTDTPLSSAGYKWQVIACDDDGDCSPWAKFGTTTPNFKIDATDPTPPGQLSLSTRSSNQITLAFGSPTVETNFTKYRIFYSTSTPVRETDMEQADANLLFKNYNNSLTTTVNGLLPNTNYYFNIWAYDSAGRSASSTVTAASTNQSISSPGAVFYTKNTRVVYYKVWNGAQWSAEKTGPTMGSAAGDNIRQIRALRSDDGGKIAVFVKTDDGTNREWWATVYNFAADTFRTATQLGTAAANGTNNQLISGCMAALSGGEFMVMTADSDVNGDTRMYSWSAASGWVPEGTGPYTSANVLASCKLVRRPGTDNYIAVMHDDSNSIYVSYYYGGSTYSNSWTTPERESTVEYSANNFAGDAFFDPGNNTRGAIQYTNSGTNTYTNAKYFVCTDTTINTGSAVASPQTAPNNWNSAVVSGEFAVNGAGSGNGYFLGRDTSLQLNLYKVNVSNPTIAWSTTTGGDNLSSGLLYADTNETQLPFAIDFYKDDKGFIVWNRNAIGNPMFNTFDATTNTVSAAVAVTGAPSDQWTRVRAYDDPGEEQALLLYQNDNVDYSAVFWDGANNSFYSSGNQAWTNIASGLTVADRDDENVTFAYSSYDIAPNTPSALGQFKSNQSTAIANQGWTNESSVYFSANVSDPDTSEGLKAYLELIANTDTFVASTTGPFNACTEATSFTGCNSKIWEIASSSIGDYSVTPLVATATISGLSDNSIGYKWRVISCDDEGKCSPWSQYDSLTPNFKVDTLPPSPPPGPLTVASVGSGQVVLNFGSSTVEDNFLEYRIYYKAAVSGVTQGDSLFSSTTDAHLASKIYGGFTSTTIGGLSSSTQYVFNIWAYDQAGNTATASPEVSTTTKTLPNIRQISYILENDSGANVNSNTPASSTYESNLSNVHLGERTIARFQIENNGGDISANKVYRLQYDTDGNNAWTDVGTSTAISYSLGLSGSNGDPLSSTKARPNAKTFSPGAWYENASTTNATSLNSNAYTDIAFAVKTNSAANGHVYRLRLYNASDNAPLNAYSLYPSIATEANSARRFSKEAGSLAATPADLIYYLDTLGYKNVAANDEDRDEITSSANIPVQYFAIKNANNTDALSMSWNGQSSVTANAKKIYIQVYTYGSPNQWVTVASTSNSVADTDFDLSAVVNSGLSMYYGAGNWTYWRIYQESGTETLRTDYFNVAFSAPVPETSLSHYRWRNDDGSEATATWRESEDVGDPTGATLGLDKNTNVRLRIAVKNTGAGSASSYAYRLEFATTTGNCTTDPGGWTAVAATSSASHWRMATSSYISNGSSLSSSRLSSDGNTYLSGYAMTYPSATSSPITLAEARYTELEYDILATNNAVTAGTYCFRVTNNGASLTSYAKYPVITLAGNNNTAPAFSVGGAPYDSDSIGGSSAVSPTNYGDTVKFGATAADNEGDSYYLAICKANSITAGNDGPPICGGAGSWCVSGLATSSTEATCNYTASDANETLAWYAFVCDKHAGFSIAKCSLASQGSGDAETDSPFVINHPPAFTAVSTLVPSQNPGATFTFRANASDSDVANAADTVTLYVCDTNSATWSGCSGATFCSSASSTNPECSYTDIAPTPAGSVTYYAFIFDSHSLGAQSNSRTSTYSINNVAPIIGTISLNNGLDISPNIKGMPDTAVTVVSTSTVDMNGCNSIVSAVGSLYISNAANGPTCTADSNYCYQMTTSNCAVSDCSGPNDTSAVITCTANLKYYVMPTDDFSNNPALNWIGYMQVNDGTNMPIATSSPVDVLTNIALDVQENLINFGSNMYAGQNTGSWNATTTVVNAGNSPIDTNVCGTDMSSAGYTINVNNIRYGLSNFNYNFGTPLTNGGANVDINDPKPVSAMGASAPIYWGLNIPYGADAANYNGYNTFSVMLDNDGW